MLMKIKRAKIIKNRINIIFFTTLSVEVNDIFKLNYHGKKYYFGVINIEPLDESTVKVIAEEVGYYYNRLHNLYVSNFENYLNQIIDMSVNKVTNSREIAKVKKDDLF